jgi:Flp pilus assembly CpaE family ATPase
MSVALIGPNEGRRTAMNRALGDCPGVKVREFSSYPTAFEDVPRLLEQYFDVIIIDLDSDPDFALELVESICAMDAAVVMVYSAMTDRDLLVQCMRAGAREFLVSPFDQALVAEAMVRAATGPRPKARASKKAAGKTLVFLGAKGGAGVTTIACNMAIALAQESEQRTLLIDLALPMGDAALNLGIAAEYSTDHAFQDVERLDGAFLLKLVAKHRSGVSVLAAPSKVPEAKASAEAIDKLIAVARQEFDNVIVDLGSRIDLVDTSLFKDASTIYLVTQAGISELRNSNRLISRFFGDGGPKLEIVINRFERRTAAGVNEEHITKALGRPVRWKIPDDQEATRQMQNPATATSLADSPISRLILEMASSVTGNPVQLEAKKKGFSFKAFGRSVADKITPSDEPVNIINFPRQPSSGPPSVKWKAPEPIPFGSSLGPHQLNAEANGPGSLVYTPGPGYVLPPGTHTLWVTFNPSESDVDTPVQSSVSITVLKAKPAIQWSDPAQLACGTPLGPDHLNATSQAPGTFTYTPAAGEMLPAGTHTLSVLFTPENETNYSTAEATVTITVAKAAPTIQWNTPEPIHCGAPLGPAQLNATSTVPGNFEYAPAAGDRLSAGTHSLHVTFYPADEANYIPSHASALIVVTKATPQIAWNKPEPIVYGTLLSNTQHNAVASVSGSFAYNPPVGALLAAGEHTPTLIFTPTETSDYVSAEASTLITVLKAVPSVVWNAPEPIVAGSPLRAKQLNASASVPGSFLYTPAEGEVLAPGVHTISVTFIPRDTMNYTTAQAAVSLVVAEPTPAVINWPSPSTIYYGTPLSAAQLNASASVPGTFDYAPAAGNVLAPGKYTLSVIFTPADADKYAPADASVTLVVDALPEAQLSGAADRSIQQALNDAPSTHHDDGQWRSLTGISLQNSMQRETRTYKGAIYEKGEDGQWHLQQK